LAPESVAVLAFLGGRRCRSALRHTVTVGLRGQLWVVGGYTDGWTPTRSVFEYKPGGITGRSGRRCRPREGDAARNLSVNEEYDPGTDRWRRRADMPTPRSGIAAAVLDGAVLVFSGESPGGTFNQAEAYEPARDAWTSPHQC
jgi:hypothetical protein